MVDVVAGKGHDEEEKLFAGDEEVLVDRGGGPFAKHLDHLVGRSQGNPAIGDRSSERDSSGVAPSRLEIWRAASTIPTGRTLMAI